MKWRIKEYIGDEYKGELALHWPPDLIGVDTDEDEHMEIVSGNNGVFAVNMYAGNKGKSRGGLTLTEALSYVINSPSSPPDEMIGAYAKAVHSYFRGEPCT